MPRITNRYALLALGLLMLWGVDPARAQLPGRLIDVIEVDQRDSQTDITLQFNCSLRYAGHTPESEGPELRLRLRLDPDCGASFGAAVPLEIPTVLGGEGLVSNVRMESNLGGEIELLFTWIEPQTFVIAQGASARGLRVRLLRIQGKEPARVLVEPTAEAESLRNFAVNLDSQREPYPQEALELAAQRLQAPAFVSETEVAGEKWYRLRVGPFDQRGSAENALRLAANDYPRAWIAIGDDDATSNPNTLFREDPLPPVETMGVDPALSEQELKQLLEEARKTMRAKNYEQAIPLLTRLQRQPEFLERAQVQELLGLARERSGQVAHAKAEFEEYLRRYRDGAAAPRIRQRLRILRAAALDPRGGIGGNSDLDHAWRMSGGISQLYRRDSFGTDFNTRDDELFTTIVQDAVFNDADFFARKQGERFDFTGRINGGYERSLLDEGPESRTRIVTAYFDMGDRLLGLRGRAGRQTHTNDGGLGTFDGIMGQYQFLPSWRVRAIAGYPVEDAAEGPETERRFTTLAVGYAPEMARWDASAYVTTQTNDGIEDRQAIGVEARYFVPKLSVVGLLDYDTSFSSLNSAVVLGTAQIPYKWSLTFDLEHRNAPVLTARNALYGQNVRTLNELRLLFTEDEILQLAKDRTPVLSSYVLSARRPLGERFEVYLDLFSTQFDSTPASGNVEAQPSSGTANTYQVQFLASSLIRSGDYNQLAFRYDTSTTANTTAVVLTSRIPVWRNWRFGPRVRVEQRVLQKVDATQMLYVPAGRIDWQSGRNLIEIEAGLEIGKNPDRLEIGNTQRAFVSVGYRLGF